jgi:CRISPR-associated protein Cas1
MRNLLNTLYVTTQGSYLSRDGETVLVRVEKETKLRVPIHTLGGIVCFGQVSCSPPLMGLCGERNVAISFLSERGQILRESSGASLG